MNINLSDNLFYYTFEFQSAGNEAFKSGRYTEAVEHYTVALSTNIESRPFAAICFCNRAAALQALGQIADAIADCSLAMALDENYTKVCLYNLSLVLLGGTVAHLDSMRMICQMTFSIFLCVCVCVFVCLSNYAVGSCDVYFFQIVKPTH